MDIPARGVAVSDEAHVQPPDPLLPPRVSFNDQVSVLEDFLRTTHVTLTLMASEWLNPTEQLELIQVWAPRGQPLWRSGAGGREGVK